VRLRGILVRSAAALASAATVAVAATLVWISRPLPPTLLARDPDPGIVVEDRNGLVLHASRAGDGSRVSWVAFPDIDPDIINAFVAVEDRRFWEHGGVDLRAVGRATRDNLRARRVVSGASTITMQLARLVRPARRSWLGKVRQVAWAWRIERHLAKQRILEEYLNRVHLGQATVGVGAASALYFDALASEVSVGQAATLAGLAHAPARDNPHTGPARSRARRNLALARMKAVGTASGADVTRARAEPLVVGRASGALLAPHFTTRVLSWVTEPQPAARVRTSLDLPLQIAVEAEVKHTTQVLQHLGVKHAAAVVLDNATGEILAWVGSPDFWSPDDGQTDMVASARQPGSALKPFLYGLAFDRGYTAATVLPDIPKTYATATGPYAPRNYDRRFRGPVRAREALASSYNVPAVELASRLGASSFLHTLHLAGFESLRRDASHYGLGLALGNGDVTLIEIANAYRALANGGVWSPWRWRAGQSSVPLQPAENRRVLSAIASATVLDILRDPTARIPGFGTATPFDFPFPVAVKTGTSRHFTDNWAIATTGNFTVAVWAGNFSGRPMAGVSGVTGAGPLLHRVVLMTAGRFPPGTLTSPADLGAKAVPVCRLSGLRATTGCARLVEWFAEGAEPRDDDWERDGRVTLPQEYAAWASPEVRVASDPEPVGAVTDTAIAEDSRHQRFRIVSPVEGDHYVVPPGVESRYATIALRAVGAGDAEVRWSVDGRPHAASRWQLSRGAHVIRARSDDRTAEVRIVVE
jgi:penicillin-binding protein 1C